MTTAQLSLSASVLLAVTGIAMFALGWNLLWSALVFVVSLAFLGYYVRESYRVIRSGPPTGRPFESPEPTPPDAE